MKKYKTIEYKEINDIVTISLNRPDKRNAFNDEMIGELKEAFGFVEKSPGIRALILEGNGKVFSAGADLNWMKKMKDFSYEENLEDSQNLQELFEKLHSLSVPTITKIHGACIGGAIGLAASSDIVLAKENTVFRFGEVKLGLIPATIAPFVLERTGLHPIKSYMLTGLNFDAHDALRMQLVDFAGSNEAMDTQLDIIIKELNNNSSEAVKNTKKMLQRVTKSSSEDTIKKTTIDMIAKARISEDAQEGMNAFLEKRKASWRKN
jgi:methylglutaconyl-CoA hydratase